MRTPKYQDNIKSAFAVSHLLSLDELKTHIPQADFSTLYRNVEQMVKSGILREVILNRRDVKYELASAHVHDHFVCDECGEVTTVPPVSALPGIGKPATVVYRGQCEGCE